MRLFSATYKWIGIALILVVTLATACGEDEGNPSLKDNFDQKAFLTHLGGSIIAPAYLDLAEKTSELHTAIEAFVALPAPATLSHARSALLEARLSFQYCTPYQFGPAETLGLSSNLNVFPVDRTKIERNIESQSYNLEALSNNDAKGFPAIEFLLHGNDKADIEIIAEFELNQAFGTYLLDVSALVQATAEGVSEMWSAEGGDYLGEFTSDDALGADAGSSLGKLVNALNLSFERNTRDAKIGIPAGIRSLGIIIPEATEAFYAGYSVQLALANTRAFQMLFLGKTKAGVDGLGLDDYLNARNAKTATGTEQSLTEAIKQQFEVIFNGLEQLEDPLARQIETSNEPVQQVFAQMQQLAVLLKTDMASALGVVISYQDNDGD